MDGAAAEDEAGDDAPEWSASVTAVSVSGAMAVSPPPHPLSICFSLLIDSPCECEHIEPV